MVGFTTASFANNTEAPSPYYIQELKTLVRQAPTAYAENIALHYLTLAKQSKKMKTGSFTLSPNDFETLKAAFQSEPSLNKMIAGLQSGAGNMAAE
jgi:hypothetical protein